MSGQSTNPRLYRSTHTRENINPKSSKLSCALKGYEQSRAGCNSRLSSGRVWSGRTLPRGCLELHPSGFGQLLGFLRWERRQQLWPHICQIIVPKCLLRDSQASRRGREGSAVLLSCGPFIECASQHVHDTRGKSVGPLTF